MIDQIMHRLVEHPDMVRVVISDREGLLIASARGLAGAATAVDAALPDDLWNAYLAQYAANITLHLKNITLSRPLEMIVHGSSDSCIIAWLSAGWLIVRVRSGTDWPTMLAAVRDVQHGFDELTGEPAYARS